MNRPTTLLRSGDAPRNGLRLLAPLVLVTSLLAVACGAGAGAAATTAPAPSPSLSPSPSAVPSPSSATTASALQDDFVHVVEQVSPSVVVVETATGLGSGVVFDSTGDIVTNNHVVAGSTKLTVTLADGQKLAGTVVGTYPAGDIAVVHVTGTNLKPAAFGDSSTLVVGDIVLAVGNPLGLQSSVTQGIVSAVGRSVPESTKVTLPDVIQTSAEINPGNSGGALVNLAGQVVGIPTLGALDPEFGNTPATGIGFAISSNTAVDIANQLIASGQVSSTPRPAAATTVAP